MSHNILWIILALIAYFIDALVFIVDKYLLSGSWRHPSAYAFYVSVLNVVLVLLLLPFAYSFIQPLPFSETLVALVSGLGFFIGLFFLYQAIQAIDINEVMPAIGAVSALITFALSWKFLPGAISTLHIYAFLFLVLGALMMSYFHLSSWLFLSVLGAATGLAVSFVSLKHVFTATEFLNGLFWTRWGLVIGSLAMLVVPSWRRQIMTTTLSFKFENSFIFLLNKLLAAATFIILYYAIKIGNVVFINAMQGVQYVFMLAIGALLYKAFPVIFWHHQKDFTPRRILATVFIITGLVFLFM